MDRQKKIPQLTTKITRKLAHESADHNQLMNFYSSISRDETGAPKRWKMSNPECIDESSLTSNKKGKKKSTEVSPKDVTRGRRSLSAENNKKRKMSDIGTDSVAKVIQNGDAAPKKKRGRPKSLDLSQNGDDDRFKSPDPLTPVNVIVKRRKGRPKETPPTLVAETSTVPEHSEDAPSLENMYIESENVPSQSASLPPVQKEKKKPGRKPKLNKQVLVNKKNVLSSFSVKRGLVLNSLGRKKLLKPASSKLKQIHKGTNINASGEQSTRVNDNSSFDDGVESANDADGGVIVEKRKPGRPPGVKNKKPPLLIKTKKKGTSVANNGKLLLKKAMMKKKKLAKADKVVVARKIISKPKAATEASTSVSAMDISSDDNKLVTTGNELDKASSVSEETVNFPDNNQNTVEIQTDCTKSDKDLKSKDPLRTLNAKQKVGARSLGKLKKDKAMKKVKNKRILTSQASNSDALKSLAHLAPNDLRRKLQSKLIEKLSGKRLSIPNNVSETIAAPVAEPAVESGNKLTVLKVKPENSAYVTSLGTDIQNLSAQVEQKRVTKTDQDGSGEIKRRRPGRPRKSSIDQKDVAEFNDNDSVCSEISTVSVGSMKKVTEKQVLILGEDNVDSDNDTVRTRQRFEIIPGKKRKRTLSGEFDLVDERQLRKEMKVPASGDDTCTSTEWNETLTAKQRIRSPVKISPETIQKLKQSSLEKKAISPYDSAHRARLLRQSPFLTRLKRKRNKPHWMRRKMLAQKVIPSTEPAAEQIELSELHDSPKDESLLVTKAECLDVLSETADDIIHEEPVLPSSVTVEHVGSTSEKVVAEVSVSEVKIYGQDLKEETEPDKKPLAEVSDEEYVRLLLEELVDQIVGPAEVVKDEKVGEGRDSMSRESVATSSDSVASQSAGPSKRKKKKKGWHLLKQNRTWENKASDSSTVVKPAKVRQNARKSFRQEKESPDSTMVRKIELRQKISRSPLDNIALKQSLEENEYYKNEAQKAIKKEAKQLKLRRMFYPQDNTEEIALDDSGDGETSDFEVCSQSFTVEDLLKQCRPCSVILTDFIKQLQRAQGSLSTDDQESDGFISSETETDVFEDGEAVKDDQFKDEVSETIETAVKDEASELEEKKEDDTPNVAAEIVENKSLETENLPEPVQTKSSPAETEIVKTTKSPAPSAKNQSITNNKTPKIGPVRKRGPKATKSPANRKIKGATASPQSQRKKNMPIAEQQTARKTVPPLKLKLKVGTSSKRKTYMVEPSSELGKIQINEKKRLKASRAKMASKAASALEKGKHNKNRRKSPGLSDSNDKVKKYTKKAPVPTDAYEANFLQFIEQEKTKPITGLLAASKARQNRKMHEKQQYKANSEGSLTVTAKGSTGTTVSTNLTMVTTSKASTVASKDNVLSSHVSQTVLPEVPDSEAVNYICSQCDKVACSSEEEIIKHFKEVHPNDEMLYKPLTEYTSEDGIHGKGKLGPDNIFDRMNTLLPEDNKGTAGAHSELGKTSAEADSTTDINHEQDIGNKDDECAFPDIDGNLSDSGSLNLKIVEVVSLKDQPMDLPELSHDSPVLSQPQLSQSSMVQMSQETSAYNTSELKIPNYPRVTETTLQQEPVGHYSHGYGQKDMTQQSQGGQKKKTTKGGVGNTFKCDKCNVHAPLLAAMVAHLRNTHKDIPRLFQCPYCRHMEAESEAKIHSHIRQYHPTDNPNPPVALSEPAKKNLKTLSVKLPDIVKPGEVSAIERDIYMCLKCKVHMSTLEMINEHLEAEHKEVFVFMCPICKQFKSHAENLVLNHLRSVHPLMSESVSISLAIDGRQFTRVQCLIKDKSKSSHKQQQHSPAGKTAPPPTNPFSHQNLPSFLNGSGQQSQSLNTGLINTGLLAISEQYNRSIVATTNSTVSLSVSNSSALSAPKPILSTSTQSGIRPASHPKKKKNLLESIEQLKSQKQLEQQSIQNPTTTKPVQSTPGSNPPPLMRGPPPLIRYDQLGKVPATMLNATVQPETNLSNQSPYGAAQRLNPLSPKTTMLSAPRPIQSSLFDTSDPDAFKPINREKTVLNVPSIPRPGNRFSPKGQTGQPHHTVSSRESSGAPLDLSKSTPSSSPVPSKDQTPKESPGIPEGLNPDMFKVFNLQPTAATLRSPLVSSPANVVPQMPAQVIIPQQVRPNTSNTLAYRPSIPHVASSQIPQIISMPMGVIGNMLVSLSSVPQPLQAVQAGIQGAPTLQAVPATIQPAPNMQAIQAGLQTAPSVQGVPQFIRMNAPVPIVSHIATPTTVPRTLIPVAGNQLMNLPTFKCPYCPKVIPLKLAEVQPHIEKLHPGSSIVFMPLDSSK